MLILKCTKKVQSYLNLTPSDLLESSSGEVLFGAWYVNMFMLDRRKALIFMSERTLLSFILFGVKKTNTSKSWLPDICLSGIVQLLQLEQIPMEQIGRVIDDCFESGFSNTTSKSALGNMNDLVALYQFMVMYDGGLAHCNLNEIMQKINSTPQRNLGWKDSIEVSKELLAAHVI